MRGTIEERRARRVLARRRSTAKRRRPACIGTVAGAGRDHGAWNARLVVPVATPIYFRAKTLDLVNALCCDAAEGVEVPGKLIGTLRFR